MRPDVYAIWRRNGLVWLVLLFLLGLTFTIAHVPLGSLNVVAGLVIAAIKVSFVVVIFMGLGHSSALVRVAAAAGIFWLVILFALTLTDLTASRQRPVYATGIAFGEQSVPRGR